MSQRRSLRGLGVVLVTGPILSLIAFVVGYYLDPLNFGEREPIAAIPALLLSVVVLLITHSITSFQEIERVSADSERIHAAVQNYLHVTKVGTPKTAWEYMLSRLPAVEEVLNTSFNLPEEQERASERLYEADSYQRSPRTIGIAIQRGLRWKDVCDAAGVDRMRAIRQEVAKGKHSSRYEFRKITHREPQISFVLLTYADGTREVLFNWDFRAAGQEPTVLLSRDRDIVNMFAVQFEHLWRAASPDHDSSATRSTS